MKTIFPTQQIPELWFNQILSAASNPSHNLYFEHATIYSYGPHFPIAKHHSHESHPIIAFTTRSYSVTTASHISRVRSVIPTFVPVIETSNVNLDINLDTLTEIQQRINEQVQRVQHARQHKGWNLVDLDRLASMYRNCARYLSSESLPHLPSTEWRTDQEEKALRYMDKNKEGGVDAKVDR